MVSGFNHLSISFDSVGFQEFNNVKLSIDPAELINLANKPLIIDVKFNDSLFGKGNNYALANVLKDGVSTICTFQIFSFFVSFAYDGNENEVQIESIPFSGIV